MNNELYDFFLFTQLALIKHEELKSLAYDEQYEELIEMYESFQKQDNNKNIGLYEAIEIWLNNNIK
jgi:hypothetical protein